MYIVSYEKAKDNFDAVSDAFEKHDVPHKIAYSCKTNNAKEVVTLMCMLGAIPEVVSDYELDMVESEDFVILNGVAWKDMNRLARCVERGYLVNFNSYEQMASVLRLVSPDSKNKEIGIRVNFDNDSKFGICQYDVEKAVRFAESQGFTISCIHCHISGSRPKGKYKKKVEDMVSMLLWTGIKPKYIDFGGNMYSKMPPTMGDSFYDVCSFDDYAEIIADGLKTLGGETPTVIVELGTALIANAVRIQGRVISTDEYGRVYLDISKYAFGNMIPLLTEVRYYKREMPNEYCHQTICGCTCMEDDIIYHTSEKTTKFEVGDVFIFDNCGAYTYSLCPDFIVEKGGVIVV